MSEENHQENGVIITELIETTEIITEIAQVDSPSSLNGITPVKNGLCKTPKKEKSITPDNEKRERYHRECAEVAKKKIKLDFNNTSDSPDGKNSNSNYDNENLCEQIPCTTKICCLELSPGCYKRTGYENPEFFHVTRGEHICNICFENIIRM